jgi:O-antigen ligase
MVFGIWRCARAKVLPWRHDWVNWSILLFILIGSIRMPEDFRAYSFMSVRDFATIYYSLFFFIAQDWARHPATRLWIERCLTLGFSLVVPAFAGFELWPDFIVDHTSVNGVPLIYVKSDVACGFMLAGLFWFLGAHLRKPKAYLLFFAAVNLVGVFLCNSRAGVVAFLFCVTWLLVLGIVYRTGPILYRLTILGALGLVALVVEASLPKEPGETSQIYRIYESARTVIDVTGQYVPETSNLADKADNNRFRSEWWRTVIQETQAEGLWFGLGFGRDLAAQFVQIYYPEGGEDFNVRSPHNVLVSIFARMGVVGLAVSLMLLCAIAGRTWRDARLRPEHQPNPAWLGAWGIFITACFGVVLEGPMGAIVFWTLLGLANSYTYEIEGPTDFPLRKSRKGEHLAFPVAVLG